MVFAADACGDSFAGGFSVVGRFFRGFMIRRRGGGSCSFGRNVLRPAPVATQRLGVRESVEMEWTECDRRHDAGGSSGGRPQRIRGDRRAIGWRERRG